MQPVATVKTDAQGRYNFDRPELGGAPMLVRVPYRNVNYHQSVPPGTATADVEVFEYLGANTDGSPKLGASIFKQTSVAVNNPTPVPVAPGTTGTQYISRIQLNRGGSVVQKSYSVAVFAP